MTIGARPSQVAVFSGECSPIAEQRGHEQVRNATQTGESVDNSLKAVVTRNIFHKVIHIRVL